MRIKICIMMILLGVVFMIHCQKHELIDDYAHKRDLGNINGSKPFLNIGFKESLLLRVRIIEDN